MPYVEGFVAAVPAANKDLYARHAAEAAALFREFGATRLVETWGDEVPDGKLTDFRSAVKAKDDEVVVFAWIEYPDKATRDAANEKVSTDPRMKEMSGEMPFDGMRMIYGGFTPIIDDGPKGVMGYADGMLVPVREGSEDAYRDFSVKAGQVFLDHGAIRVVDAWADDVPAGKVTDYARAVKAEPGETVVYSWIEWPSRDARVEGWRKVMEDPRMQPGQPMPFDGRRMIYGGFAPLLVA
jgi:uncharacterized protein YbaA (DUF1428 family)